jgi:hypothetical protein
MDGGEGNLRSVVNALYLCLEGNRDRPSGSAAILESAISAGLLGEPMATFAASSADGNSSINVADA